MTALHKRGKVGSFVVNRNDQGQFVRSPVRIRHPLDLTYFDLSGDPGNDFVQYLAQARGGFKSEH